MIKFVGIAGACIKMNLDNHHACAMYSTKERHLQYQSGNGVSLSNLFNAAFVSYIYRTLHTMVIVHVSTNILFLCV
jgi:hypothetical protein